MPALTRYRTIAFLEAEAKTCEGLIEKFELQDSQVGRGPESVPRPTSESLAAWTLVPHWSLPQKAMVV